MMLADKVAIVTGASRGIGRSIANTLAENGASLAIVGTNLKLLNEVCSDVEKMGMLLILKLQKRFLRKQ